MNIKNIDFSKVDYTIIEDDMKMIEKEVLALKKDKRYMKKLHKYQYEKNTTVTFNNIDKVNKKKSNFIPISNNTFKKVSLNNEASYKMRDISSCG